MAKISKYTGPSDALQNDPTHPAYMGEGETSSPGTSSTQSQKKQTSIDDNSNTSDQQPVRTTESRSRKGRTASGSVSTTDGNTKEARRK